MVRPLTLLYIFQTTLTVTVVHCWCTCQELGNAKHLKINEQYLCFPAIFSQFNREHFEMSRLHLTGNNNKPEDWNRNILDRKFSKNLWPESMTIQTAILSRKIRNLIRNFLTYKFPNTFKVLNHSARKWFKSSNLNR